MHVTVEKHIHKYGSVHTTHTSSQYIDRKVAGVISRIRLTHEKNPSLYPNPTPSLQTHTCTRSISHPHGCLFSRHRNPLKITFSYYPYNGGMEGNFNSCSQKRDREEQGSVPHARLLVPSCRGEKRARQMREEKNMWEREVEKVGKKFKKKLKGKDFYGLVWKWSREPFLFISYSIFLHRLLLAKCWHSSNSTQILLTHAYQKGTSLLMRLVRWSANHNLLLLKNPALTRCSSPSVSHSLLRLLCFQLSLCCR